MSEENVKMYCSYCGAKIVLKLKNIKYFETGFERTPLVECPKCNRLLSISYKTFEALTMEDET